MTTTINMPYQYIAWFRGLPAAQRQAFLKTIASKTFNQRNIPEWSKWNLSMFPGAFGKPNAQFHDDFWEWVWSVEPARRPRPWIGIWPRDTGKTTAAEVAAIRLGCTGTRTYFWYVQETQDQADKRIETIATKLESAAVARRYPTMSDRLIGKFGQSRGWRRQYVRTAAGTVYEAVGIDKAVRSSKVGDARPDCIIIDDIDGLYDSPHTIQKKIDTLTQTILPAATDFAAILFIQNLIHPNSIASKLVNGDVDFLADRIISGPFPAIEDIEIERVYDDELEAYIDLIIGGTPTWAGQSIKICQGKINKDGITSFRRESQHDVTAPPGGMFDHLSYSYVEHSDIRKKLYRVVCWVDPAVTDTDNSDSMGIQIGGIMRHPKGPGEAKTVRLYSWEGRSSPEDCLKRAFLKAIEYNAESVGIETNQGGDTWESVWKLAWQALVEDPTYTHITNKTRRPGFKSAKATSSEGSKRERASKVLMYYERGLILHAIGTHDILEDALNRFPLTKPLDLVDAGYYEQDDLRNPGKYKVKVIPMLATGKAKMKLRGIV